MEWRRENENLKLACMLSWPICFSGELVWGGGVSQRMPTEVGEWSGEVRGDALCDPLRIQARREARLKQVVF